MGEFKEIVHSAIADGYDTEETMECLTLIIDDHMEHLKHDDPSSYHKVITKIKKMFDGDHMTRDMLKKASTDFVNADGSRGFKWSVEATTAAAESMGVAFDQYSKEDFNYVMNMMYSDYSTVLAKYNLSKPSVYVELTDAFLDDADAPSDKAVRYYKAMSE